MFDYLRLARTVGIAALPASQPPAAPHQAAVKPPSPPRADGASYLVTTREGLLRLRREPLVDPAHPEVNVVARLPAGQRVTARGEPAVNGFLAVETSLCGALYRGYLSEQFLRDATPAERVAKPVGAIWPSADLVATRLVTRADLPGPSSLNETDAPARRGHTPAELRAIGTALYGPERGWQRMLAAALKVNECTVSRWMSGDRNMSYLAVLAVKALEKRG